MEPGQPPRFRIALHRAKGCYFACVVDLPGCYSRGASEVEALENARAAIRSWLWIRQVLANDSATLELELGP
jgi:predicted RNase H-like HicB family nuclease